MSNIIYLKIDVTLIDKAKLFAGKKANKEGKMPQYLDCVCIPKRSDFGDTHMIVQSVSKEERLAGKKGSILGNAKEQGAKGEESAPVESNPRRKPTLPPQEDDTDLPF